MVRVASALPSLNVPQQGLYANMPASGTGSGALYYATDDGDGSLNIDLTAGQPYKRVAPRGELFSAVIGSLLAINSGTQTLTQLQTPLIAPDDRPLWVTASIPSFIGGSAGTVTIDLLNVTDAVAVDSFQSNLIITSAAHSPPWYVEYRIPPGTAAKVYAVQVNPSVATTVGVPAYISVVER